MKDSREAAMVHCASKNITGHQSERQSTKLYVYTGIYVDALSIK